MTKQIPENVFINTSIMEVVYDLKEIEIGIYEYTYDESWVEFVPSNFNIIICIHGGYFVVITIIDEKIWNIKSEEIFCGICPYVIDDRDINVYKDGVIKSKYPLSKKEKEIIEFYLKNVDSNVYNTQ